MTTGLADTSVFIARESGRPLGGLPDDFSAMSGAHPELDVLRV